ncbi:MAG: hypothetical protein CNLJKLNK_00583 [Holosporales bacterium]
MLKVIITGMIVCKLLNGMSAQGTQVQHEIQQEMRTVEEQIRSKLDYCASSTILKIKENNLIVTLCFRKEFLLIQKIMQKSL